MEMNTRRWMLPAGMIAVFAFLALTMLGKALWPSYSAIRSYVSVLISEQSPHVHLMRFLFNFYTIGFCVYSLAIAVHACRSFHWCCKTGFTTLFVLSYLSVLGYGTVPIGMDMVLAANDLFHLVFTTVLLGSTAASLILIATGFLKQEKLVLLGRISLAATLLFILFNAWHLIAILTGQQVLGLLQRLTFYSFHAFTFYCSWIFTFKRARA